MSNSNNFEIAGLPIEVIIYNLPVGMTIIEKSSGRVVFANKVAVRKFVFFFISAKALLDWDDVLSSGNDVAVPV